MLPPFQVRGLRISATNPQQAGSDQVVAEITQQRRSSSATASTDSDGPWVDVRLQRENQYDEIIRTYPEAALGYLDEDDGDLITVGSSHELFSRISELEPQYPIVFDVLDDRGLPVWRVQFQQLDEDQRRITISRPSSPGPSSPRSSSPRPNSTSIQESQPTEAERSNPSSISVTAATGTMGQPLGKDETEKATKLVPLLDMFESELARLVSEETPASVSQPQPSSSVAVQQPSERAATPSSSEQSFSNAPETAAFETPLFNLLSTIPQRNQQMFSSLRSTILNLAQISAQAARSAATLSRDLPVNEFENSIKSLQTSLHTVARDAAAAAAQAAEATRTIDVSELQRAVASMGSTVKEIGEAYQHVGGVVGAEVKKVVREVMDEVRKGKNKGKGKQTPADQAKEKEAIERAMREFLNGDVLEDQPENNNKNRDKGKSKAKAADEAMQETSPPKEVPETCTTTASKQAPPRPTVEDVPETEPATKAAPPPPTVEETVDEDGTCPTRGPDLPEVFPIPIPENEPPIEPRTPVRLNVADIVPDDITSPPSYRAATSGTSYLRSAQPLRQSPVWPRAPEHDDEGESSDSTAELVSASDDEDERDAIPGRFSPSHFGSRSHVFNPSYSSMPPVSPPRVGHLPPYPSSFNPWRNRNLSPAAARTECLRRGLHRRDRMRMASGSEINGGDIPICPIAPELRHRMSCPSFGPMFTPHGLSSPHHFPQHVPPPLGMPHGNVPLNASPPHFVQMPPMPHMSPNLAFHHVQNAASWRAPGSFGYPISFPPAPAHAPPPPPPPHCPPPQASFVPPSPFSNVHHSPTFAPNMQSTIPSQFNPNFFGSMMNNSVNSDHLSQAFAHTSAQQQVYNIAVKRAMMSVPIPGGIIQGIPELSRRMWLEVENAARSVCVPFGVIGWDRMPVEEQTRLWREAGEEAMLRASEARRQQEEEEEIARMDNPFATPPRVESPIYMNLAGSHHGSLQPDPFNGFNGSRPGSATMRSPNPPPPTPSRMYSAIRGSPVLIPPISPIIPAYHSPYAPRRRSSMGSNVSNTRNMYGSRGRTSSTIPMASHSLPTSPEILPLNIGALFAKPSVPAVPIDQRHGPPVSAVPADNIPGSPLETPFERISRLHTHHRATPPVPEVPEDDVEILVPAAPTYFRRSLPPRSAGTQRAYFIPPLPQNFTMPSPRMPPFTSSSSAHVFSDIPRTRNPFCPLAPSEIDLQDLPGHLQDGWIRTHDRLDEEDESDLDDDDQLERDEARSEVSSADERRGRSPTARGPRAQMDIPIVPPKKVHYAGWKQEEQPSNQPIKDLEEQLQQEQLKQVEEQQPKVPEKEQVQEREPQENRDEVDPKPEPEPIVEEGLSRLPSPAYSLTQAIARPSMSTIPPAPSIPRRSPTSSRSPSPNSPGFSPYRSAPSSPIIAGPSSRGAQLQDPVPYDPFGILGDVESDSNAERTTKMRIDECIANLIDMGYGEGDMGPEQLHVYAEAVGGDIEKALDLLIGGEEAKFGEDLNFVESDGDFRSIEDELSRRERDNARSWDWWV